MALRDPVAVYNAATNIEAHLVRNALVNAGVEAFVTEASLIHDHKPQVWVERTDVELIKPILDDYERRAAELRDASTRDEVSAEPEVELVCKDCGEHLAFPSSQLGSVQECSHCGAYIDVGNEESPEDDAEFQSDEEVTGDS